MSYSRGVELLADGNKLKGKLLLCKNNEKNLNRKLERIGKWIFRFIFYKYIIFKLFSFNVIKVVLFHFQHRSIQLNYQFLMKNLNNKMPLKFKKLNFLQKNYYSPQNISKLPLKTSKLVISSSHLIAHQFPTQTFLWKKFLRQLTPIIASMLSKFPSSSSI